MSDGTKIEWAKHPVTGKGATWNPITGCALVSEGCRHCYAARLAGTRLKNHPSREGLARQNAEGDWKFTGTVRFNEQWLTDPLKWKAPRGIFVCAHGDLFAEGVKDEWIDQVFAVMALCNSAHAPAQADRLGARHIFFVLTKRPERMREYVSRIVNDKPRYSNWAANGYRMMLRRGIGGTEYAPPFWPLPNVWLGVSVEDQVTAETRIPYLLQTPAAKHFISAEPLLGPVDIEEYLWSHRQNAADDLPTRDEKLDWVITGGESGPKARPSHPDWFRALRDQCASAGTAFFFKQWGEFLPDRMLENMSKRGCLMRADGTRATAHEHGTGILNGTFDFTGWQHFSAIGKSRAGHMLDGIAHLDMPGVA